MDSLEWDGQVENIIIFPSEQQQIRAARLVRRKYPEKNTLRATVLDLQSVKVNTFALGDLTYVLTNVRRRDKLLFSELGMAFEMQFQAEKHQGKKAKDSKDTLTKLAEQSQTPLSSRSGEFAVFYQVYLIKHKKSTYISSVSVVQCKREERDRHDKTRTLYEPDSSIYRK